MLASVFARSPHTPLLSCLHHVRLAHSSTTHSYSSFVRLMAVRRSSWASLMLRTIGCGRHALGLIPIVLVPAASVVHGRAAHRVSTRTGRLAYHRRNLCMTTTMVCFSSSFLLLACSPPHSHASTHLRITTHASHPCVAGSICLSCWTSLTEADQSTDLVFLVQGHELSLRASARRWVLFMGYIPHESRASDCLSPATTARVRICIRFPPFLSFLSLQLVSHSTSFVSHCSTNEGTSLGVLQA
jgi:hypothetical protein